MSEEIKKYDFKTGLAQEFEIVDLAELYKKHKDTITTTHRAGFYHIIWFQQGSPTHLVDFNPIEIKPNTLLFLNKDIVHRFDNKNKFDGKVILFTDTFYCKTESDLKYLRNSILFNDLFFVSKIQVHKQSELFSDLLKLMKCELQNPKDNFQPEILKNLLHNFLLHSERVKREQNFIELKKDIDLDYVMIFKDFLEKGYKNHKQVSYYSKQICITQKRLNQATTKVLGKTPKEIIDHRILLAAKRLLAHTAKNVKEIAFDLGFGEPTNFIKYFRKHTKNTPVEFREISNME
ncbi:AraC-like DNA-binding protein [Lutibacter oceani]|uniref:AraC-like DNA-binding protein n=1 Tax=Lutibacter oceani TaxID=1853311 RepID=A0A3D9RV13_9FLAO|nr:helix-turn-helix transcriptional regulator [Lutibacter oceani]REE80946.1 AraC-like DNA-binding protein [Lutibacter oceani]